MYVFLGTFCIPYIDFIHTYDLGEPFCCVSAEYGIEENTITDDTVEVAANKLLIMKHVIPYDFINSQT